MLQLVILLMMCYSYSRTDLPVVNDKEKPLWKLDNMCYVELCWPANYRRPDDAGACPSQEFFDAYEVVNGDITRSYPLLNLESPYLDAQ